MIELYRKKTFIIQKKNKKKEEIMKKLVLVVSFLFMVSLSFARTTLSAGDLAIFGANCDNPDDFAFVLLVDIESSTEIRFTDSGWESDNTFRGNEGAVKYTAPGAISAGTVITWVGNSANFVADNDATVGTNGFVLSASGDQVFAFQGVSTSPTFIYAIQTNSNQWQATSTASTNSAIPQGLTNETNAAAVGAGSGAGDEYDNAMYDGTTNFSSPSNALSAVSNNANWVGRSSPNYTFSASDWTLPVTLSSFTVQYISNTPTLFWTTQSETNNLGWNIYRSQTDILEEAMQINLEIIPGAGTTSEPTNYVYEDYSNLEENTEYWYWLESIDYSGLTESYGPISLIIPEEDEEPGSPEIPDIYGLYQNYPNPFNPNTEISFMMKENCIAELSIYNVKGEKISTLFQNKSVSKDELIRTNWDGKDNFGKTVSSGIYLYKLRTNKENFVRKMILMK